MIAVSLGQLYDLMNAFLWPFFRILALIGVAPAVGESSVPIRVKVGLAAAITITIMTTLAPLPALPTGSFVALGLAAQQVLIGIALGLVMRIVFAAVQACGEIIGLQMGLSFASFFDPATGANTAVLSRFLNVTAILLFLSLDGHLYMLAGLVHSFTVLPIQPGPLDTEGWGTLIEWSSQVIASGMMLALPLIIVLLTISLSLGILNRTAQQFSVFAVGFPISLLSGLVLLAIVLPQTMPFLSNLFEEARHTMAHLAQRLHRP